MKTPIIRIVILTALLAAVALGSTGCVSGMILMTRKNEAFIFGHENATKEHIEKHLGTPLFAQRYEPPLSIQDVRSDNIPESRAILNESISNRDDGLKEFLRYLINGREDMRYYHELFLNGLYFEKHPGNPPPDTPIVECATYSYKGRIIPTGMIHERGVMGGHTFLLSEIVAIPVALYTVTTGWSKINIFKVWYDNTGRAWAYTWEPSKPK